jgi:hypothetical protein
MNEYLRRWGLFRGTVFVLCLVGWGVGKARWDTGDVVEPWFRGTTCRGLRVVCWARSTAYVIASRWMDLKWHFIVGITLSARLGFHLLSDAQIPPLTVLEKKI